MKENTVILNLLRHGETSAGHKFIGSSDVRLTEKGWQQMTRTVEGGNSYEAVISSPLRRCLDFAKQYADSNNISLSIEDALRELYFGDWENKSSETIWQTQQEDLKSFWQDPVNNTPPNAESLKEFNKRVNSCLENILTENRAGKILLVAHAGTIKIILANILSMPLIKINNLNISHASLSQIQCYYGDAEKHLSVNYINHCCR
jgi:broad specificity phosphatase PhoE